MYYSSKDFPPATSENLPQGSGTFSCQIVPPRVRNWDWPRRLIITSLVIMLGLAGLMGYMAYIGT